ncbi:polyprenyl synthetase family protein [Streptomyces sp. NPDC014764]|uniref:polyprenyl synthetase family protein n=1 Tax=Streptomyces sp. NPDC014764 TaxID=3364907 RepID=UPI0037002559
MQANDLSGDPAASGGRLLVRGREAVDTPLREAVARMPSPARLWTGFHFGWWDAEGEARTARQGKALRPALTLGCAEAAGGTASAAAAAGTAVELVHNFSLVHDDVIDGDRLRRGRPTLWAAFGVPAALLAGDAMLTLAYQALAAAEGPHKNDALPLLCDSVQELIAGQAADIALEDRLETTLHEYTAMASAKTGSLLGAACAVGALSAGCDPKRAAHFTRFGRHLGLAFQITDDMLGMFGDPQATGKPVGGDVARRKKTYPVLAALTSGHPAGQELTELYAQTAPLTAEQVVRAGTLVEHAGGKDLAQERARRELEQTLTSLAAADPLRAPHRELTALAHLMTHRSV